MENRVDTSAKTNPSLSVDCVIFGFDGTALRVLLVERDFIDREGHRIQDYKLPGSLIQEDEELRVSALRVVSHYLDVKDMYLRQLHVFSRPDRVSPEELRWLSDYYKVETQRVVTVAYFSLVKLHERLMHDVTLSGARWVRVDKNVSLAMDHRLILTHALERIGAQLMSEPVAFEMLPRKFTMRQLQQLYEAILGVEIDNRNFRKKVLASGYLRPTAEKEQHVAHKPALYYTFDRSRFRREERHKFRLNFSNWQL